MNLAATRFVVATHYYAPGASFELETYLATRAQRVLFIAHPLFAGDGDSYFRVIERGEVVAESRRPGPTGQFRYLTELRLTSRWVAEQGDFDVYIACDSFLAMAGLWLRRRRRARWLVLYTQDYVPRRFSNPVLNGIYHMVDRTASRRADAAWNVTSHIGKARQRRDGGRPAAPVVEVPIGTHYERIRRLPLTQAHRHQLVFVGHLLEKQGLQLAIEAIPRIRERIPDATMLVIGDGPYAPELKALAQGLGLAETVDFAGFSDDSVDIEKRIAAAAVALAPYAPDPESFTRYADPTKIKTYLACGVPVIMTDVPSNSAHVEAAGAGVVVPYDKEALAAAAIGYLSDANRLQRAREAAGAMGREYLWDRIFDTAFQQTSGLLGGQPDRGPDATNAERPEAAPTRKTSVSPKARR